MEVNAFENKVTLRPLLPNGIGVIHLENLRVAGHRLEMWVRQKGERVDVETAGAGNLDIVVHQGVRERAPAAR